MNCRDNFNLRPTFQVDHSRVNEFGFSGDMLEEAEKKKQGALNSNDRSLQQVPPAEGVDMQQELKPDEAKKRD